MIVTLSATDPIGAAEALVGLPTATAVVALVSLALLALHRRWIVLGRELEQSEETRVESLAALAEAHNRELAAASDTLQTVREDRDWWRDTALRALDLGERAVASSDRR